MLNLDGNQEDLFYRYKMDKIESRIIDRGQYSTTRIHNLGKIADSLKVDIEVLEKHFSYHLAAKVNSSDQFTDINGAFNATDLQTALQVFIDRYVLCERCGIPELHYVVNKKRVCSICQACGHSRLESDRLAKIIARCVISH